jgi:aspartate carbamoyltransferase
VLTFPKVLIFLTLRHLVFVAFFAIITMAAVLRPLTLENMECPSTPKSSFISKTLPETPPTGDSTKTPFSYASSGQQSGRSTRATPPPPPFVLSGPHISLPQDLPILTDNPSTWVGSSLLSVTQIDPTGLRLLFTVTDEMRQLVRTAGGDDRLKHKVLSTVFYEASTRTSCSFQAAMQRLGGTYIHVDGKGNSSAGQKGESLSDTIRCLECYSDITVLRHPVKGSVGGVIEDAMKPILNAGDGVGEHPTQALLDTFTIYDELDLGHTPLGTKQPSLTVVMLGDLKHGRTVHSLAKLLVHCDNLWDGTLTLRYVSPQGLEMPHSVFDYCVDVNRCLHGTGRAIIQETYQDLKIALADADVLYVTRIQRERFCDDAEYQRVSGCYVVDEALMQHVAPPNMIVLHPLPRVDEIDTAVDSDPRAAYFRQMENGMFVRMALLALTLGKRNP